MFCDVAFASIALKQMIPAALRKLAIMIRSHLTGPMVAIPRTPTMAVKRKTKPVNIIADTFQVSPLLLRKIGQIPKSMPALTANGMSMFFIRTPLFARNYSNRAGVSIISFCT